MEEIIPNNILKVSHISASYQEGKQRKTVLHDISFELHENEILGLVGESGCGKSTLSKVILGFIRPDEGEIISQVDHPQMIFQDPYASLNPRRKILDIVAEGIDAHGLAANKKERDAKVIELLETVGLQAEHADRFPHEFSGGQRQRIGIARALAVNPKFIVCDEAVSALDVSIQAQVVNMFEELQEKLGVAYLFIAHDLLVVHHISDRIAVMYLGKMMEIADADELNANPIHPYTLSLLSAVPIPDPETARKSHRIVLEGDVPSPLKMPTGCPFRTRCKYATEKCGQEMPQLTDRGNGHMVACWNK